jgi:hypothetical protein
MRKDIKKEMRWFVLKLIDIRNDLNRTPDHIADIEFEYEDIVRQESIFGTMNRVNAQRKIKEMLARIKNDGEFLTSFNNFDEKRLNTKVLPNGNIKIIGYQIKLLTTYLKENIIKGEKVFGLTTNAQHQNVLTVYGENTGQRLMSGEQFLIFCRFLSNSGRLISYLELMTEIKKSMPHDGEYYTVKYPTPEQKIEFIQTTVYNLKRKLIEVGRKYDIDINKVLETVPRKGYISHM